MKRISSLSLQWRCRSWGVLRCEDHLPCCHVITVVPAAKLKPLYCSLKYGAAIWRGVMYILQIEATWLHRGQVFRLWYFPQSTQRIDTSRQSRCVPSRGTSTIAMQTFNKSFGLESHAPSRNVFREESGVNTTFADFNFTKYLTC